MNIKPIKTEQDFNEALARIDVLMNNVEPGTPEGDELEVLLVLVMAYDDEHYPMPNQTTPQSLVLFMLEQRGLGQADLAKIMGSRSRASEFLNGKIDLSKAQVDAVSEALHIRRDLLLPASGAGKKVAERRAPYGKNGEKA